MSEPVAGAMRLIVTAQPFSGALIFLAVYELESAGRIDDRDKQISRTLSSSGSLWEFKLPGGRGIGENRYLSVWQTLPADPTDPEVQRNIGISQPLL